MGPPAEEPSRSHESLLPKARLGTTVAGKWTLERLIGTGASASVYAARHRNGHTVAVKMLHRALSGDEALRARFLREGYAANAVRHPAVPRVLDDDVTDDGSVFLVMELLEGHTLSAYARKQPGHVLAVDEVLSLAEQLLDALAEAHASGIVHRDIKPANLFRTDDGSLKLLDFGVARQDGGGSGTITGTAIGSPAYMAPEQALGKSAEIGPRSDLWSVGATMYRLLVGKPVHEGESANEVLVRAATQRATPLHDALPSLDGDVAAVIDRALSFAAADRFPDAIAFRDAVRGVQARRLGATRQRSPEARSSEHPQRSGEGTELAPPLSWPSAAFAPSSVSSPSLVSLVSSATTGPLSPANAPLSLVPVVPPGMAPYLADKPIGPRPRSGPSLFVVIGGAFVFLAFGVLGADWLTERAKRGPATTFVAPAPSATSSVPGLSPAEAPSASAVPTTTPSANTVRPGTTKGGGRGQGTKSGPIRLERREPTGTSLFDATD